MTKTRSLSRQAAAALVLGAACALLAMTARTVHRTALMPAFRPYNGQQLFTIDDFENGRINFDEHGLRGVNQVVKSNDVNIGLPDHKWEHQTNVYEAPMQEWPLTTAGMKSKTSQLVAQQGLKRLSKVDQQELQTAKRLDKEGTQLLKAAGSVPAKLDSEDPQVLEREIEDMDAQRAVIKRQANQMSAKERRLQIEYHTVLQKQRRAGTVGLQTPPRHHMAQQPPQQVQQQQPPPQPVEEEREPLESDEPALQAPEGAASMAAGPRVEGGLRWSYPMGTNIAFMSTEDFPKVMEGSWHTRVETAQDQPRPAA